MMMRYHWSLGIGHTYSHANGLYPGSHPAASAPDNNTASHEVENDMAVDANDTGDLRPAVDQADEEDPDSDDPELAMDDRENEDLGSDDGEQWDDERFNESDHDDELFQTYHMRGQ